MPLQSGVKTLGLRMPQLRNPAMANASPIETALDQLNNRTGMTHNKIPLLRAGNKGILEMVELCVERKGMTANILRGEPI
ncbi:hypothetical protein Cflav_PD3523 [Pedosphaera parvula Ellin514]|uniref:Uncharacterized protein n=1 Tax=Pedosphaera parvula (strain Ellin514) TaxID=320771 RepID=B9XI60_PEDPL|nr:hypothetical protein Cflav_PD3523 [Pedosphaera parvula Ellin514]